MPVKAAATTLAVLVGLLAVFFAAAMSVIGALTGAYTAPNPPDTAGCLALSTGTPRVAGYRADQITNATIIVAVGGQLHVPPHGRVVALSAALTESGLRNLRYGDRDSLGLFQQRPSQGWGTPAQILNPRYSATQFYRHLLAVPHWQTLSVNDAAQAVQRSATPTAYRAHEPAARTLLSALTTGHLGACAAASTGRGDNGPSRDDRRESPASAVCAGPTAATNPAARAAVAFACGHRGTPYVWGGTGQRGFDFSGLTQAAYAAAGIRLPRTAQAQFTAGPALPLTTPPQPGDLLFYGVDSRHITHVGLAVSATTMIDAPDLGKTVQLERIGHTRLIGRTQPWATTNRR